MKRVLVAAGLVALLAARAGAQTGDQTNNELVQKLLTRIDALEQRVAELEKENAAAHPARLQPGQPAPSAVPPAAIVAQNPAAPASGTPPPETAQLGHNHDQAPPVEGGPLASPLLHMEGFADFNFQATDLHGPNGGFQP